MNEYMVYSYLIGVEAVSLCGENVVYLRWKCEYRDSLSG